MHTHQRLLTQAKAVWCMFAIAGPTYKVNGAFPVQHPTGPGSETAIGAVEDADPGNETYNSNTPYDPPKLYNVEKGIPQNSRKMERDTPGEAGGESRRKHLARAINEGQETKARVSTTFEFSSKELTQTQPKRMPRKLAHTTQILYATSGKGSTSSTLYSLESGGNGLPDLTNKWSEIGPVTVNGAGITLNGLAFDPSTGALYGNINESGGLVLIDTETGNATPVGPPYSGSGFPTNLAINSIGEVYAWLQGSGDRCLLSINKGNGAVSECIGSYLETWSHTLSFDDNDVLHFVNGDGKHYTIDETTGSRTLVETLSSADRHHGDIATDPATGDSILVRAVKSSPIVIKVNLSTGTEQTLNTNDTNDVPVVFHTLAFTSPHPTTPTTPTTATTPTTPTTPTIDVSFEGTSAGTCSDHLQAIEDQTCKQEHYDQTINRCDVTCKSPRSLHSLSSRHLQSSDFEVLLSFICDTSTMDCYDRDVIEAIAADTYAQATDALGALQNALLSGGLFTDAVIAGLTELSAVPSSQPSGMPSSNPSANPSSQPSSIPSESPSSMPSEQPSELPSCTPSTAPTASGTVNLFYPDWSNYNQQGCANDGNEPTYMSVAKSTYMFSMLDKCCKQYFNWNYDGCMGLLDNTCARGLWYPDWAGSNEGCVKDGNEPPYMRNAAMYYLFTQKSECCAEHYGWNYQECLGRTGGYQYKSWYYPDWDGQKHICKNGGGQPEYMTNNHATWMYEDLTKCCNAYYGWNLAECLASGPGGIDVSPANGRWYPDWGGGSHVCLSDSKQPNYMTENYAAWMYDTQEKCCARYYGWNENACNAAVGTAPGEEAEATGTGLWYKSAEEKCSKDCKVGTGTDCGGVANNWDPKYTNRKECCAERVWWSDDCDK